MVQRKSNLCILQFDWLIAITSQREFLIVKHSYVREELSDFVLFFRHNFNKSLCNNIFFVSFHSRTALLVHAPPQLTLPPSPTNPSMAVPCAQ